MTRTCRTCPRDAAPGLLHCDRCIRDRFFIAEPSRREPFVPEWRKRLVAKDLTGYGRAA